jgi:hypothetical protein
VVLLFGVQKALEPMSWGLVQAVRELGPISGSRCAQSDPYVYDPRHEHADSGLISEPPEDTLSTIDPGVTAEKVEVNLRSGETVVWARIGAEEDGGPQRVYVLTPGHMQVVTFEYLNARGPLCMAHLGDWQIVAEHALG